MKTQDKDKAVKLGEREIAKRQYEDNKKASKYKPGMFSTGAVLGEGASEYGASTVAGALGLGVPTHLLGAGGAIAGYVSKNADPDDVKDYNALSLIPGVGTYRGIKRTQLVDGYYSKGKRRNSADVSERAGSLTTALAIAALGGLGGAYLAHKHGGEYRDPLYGAIVGATAGLGVGALAGGVGGIAGLLNPKTQDEHRKYLEDENLVAKNLFIPGYGAYQRGRRLRSMLSGTI